MLACGTAGHAACCAAQCRRCRREAAGRTRQSWYPLFALPIISHRLIGGTGAAGRLLRRPSMVAHSPKCLRSRGKWSQLPPMSPACAEAHSTNWVGWVVRAHKRGGALLCPQAMLPAACSPSAS